MRGQWVLLNAQEIREAIARISAAADKLPRARRSRLRWAARRATGSGGGPVVVEGWLKELIERLAERERIEELAPPAGFIGSLRPYQHRGYSWLGFLRRWGLGACLADDMGLGKTIQTLVHIQRDRQQRGGGTGVAGLPDLGDIQLAA